MFRSFFNCILSVHVSGQKYLVAGSKWLTFLSDISRGFFRDGEKVFFSSFCPFFTKNFPKFHSLSFSLYFQIFFKSHFYFLSVWSHFSQFGLFFLPMYKNFDFFFSRFWPINQWKFKNLLSKSRKLLKNVWNIEI